MKKLLGFMLGWMCVMGVMAQSVDDRGYLVKIGDQAPDFTTTLADGSTFKLSEQKGKVVMLQFTASWCSVCRKEMPHIESQIWQAYKDKGLVLVGVDRDEPLETLQSFAKQTGITYPLALDPKADIFGLYADKQAGVTRNVLIDRDGKIVFLTRLYDENEFNKLKEAIANQINSK